VLVDDGLAKPLLIGRREVVHHRLSQLGLRLEENRDYEITDPEDDPRYDEYWRQYHQVMERKGVSPDAARTIIRTNSTAIAALMLKRREADAMICGTYGRYDFHLNYVLNVIGIKEGVRGVTPWEWSSFIERVWRI